MASSKMDRYCTTAGIVLKEVDFGESSKMLTIFSGEHGIMRVSAKGVRKPKSSMRASAQLFCYSRFELYKKRGDVYTMTGASVLEAFYGLSADLDAFYVAGNMARLMMKVMQPELPDPETMRLLLNCLFYLSSGKRPARLIQVVFVIRLLTIQGLLPEVQTVVQTARPALEVGGVKALTHIMEATMEHLFLFTVSDTILEALERLTVDLERELL